MEKTEKDLNNIKISFITNIVISVFTVIALIIMFTGFKFMKGPETTLESTKIGMLKFFTVESNIFMGIMALIFAIKEGKFLKGKDVEFSSLDYGFKLMSTTSVVLTFLVVFAYLGPIAENGFFSMFMNSNLFLHFIIPIVSMIDFVLFEKTDKLNIKHSFCGLIPMVLYAVFYLINVLIHMENGMVSTKYDWYWFVQNGVWTAVIVVPIMLAITYFISFVLWRLNRKK